MKIIAEKAKSKAGNEYTKFTAEIWNRSKPSQPGTMYASLVGDEVKEKFAANAIVTGEGKMELMIDDRKSELMIVAEPSDYENPFLKILIYDVEIVEWEPKGESRDVFEIREKLPASEKGKVRGIVLDSNLNKTDI